MMKRFASLVLVLLLLLLAAGCRQTQEPPSSATLLTTEPTVPEATTEPKPAYTARDIYWKMRNALGLKTPNGYISERKLHYRVGTGTLALETVIQEVEQVILSAEPVQLNIGLEYKETTGGKEKVTRQATYYRSQDGNKAQVYEYYEPFDYWYYDEPTDYNYSMLAYYRVVLHPTAFPEDMTLEPETRQVGDREAYVLSYTKDVELFGYAITIEESWDLKAKELLYVDAETFELLRSVTEILEPDEEKGKLLYYALTGVEYTNTKYPLTVISYTKTYRNLNYQPMEVPPVPDEAFEALKGFDAT